MGFLKSPIYKLRAPWTVLDPRKWDVEVKGQNRGIELGLCLVLGWFRVCGWVGFVLSNQVLLQCSFMIFLCGWAGFVVGSGFVFELGLCWAIKFNYNILLWFFCVWFWVCMIFLGLCSCVFCHFGILNSFFFVCFCVICVFKFEFVFGSGFFFVFFVFLLFLILFFLFLFS